jgi:hypothetical protein
LNIPIYGIQEESSQSHQPCSISHTSCAVSEAASAFIMKKKTVAGAFSIV